MTVAGSNRVIPFPGPAVRTVGSPPELGDLRFRNLLGPEQWATLPPAVRLRFSKRLAAGETIAYTGEIIECRMGRAGRWLAQCLRLVGAPLPLSTATMVPATVAVTEDARSGGQFWTRIYGRDKGFAQVIQSSKRFSGPTGLEEYIGYGLGMALIPSVRDGGLQFRSDHYFVELGQWRLVLPNWLMPGAITVSHIDLNDGSFAFLLRLEHPLFGEILNQTVLFNDPVSSNP